MLALESKLLLIKSICLALLIPFCSVVQCWDVRIHSVFRCFEQPLPRKNSISLNVGGGYFASLRAWASSREPRASVCEPQKIPAKKSKNGQNALIWHLLHAGYFRYANTRGTPRQPKGIRLRIPYVREAWQWTGLSKTERQISVVRSKVIPNIPVRRNRNGSFIWLRPKFQGSLA